MKHPIFFPRAAAVVVATVAMMSIARAQAPAPKPQGNEDPYAASSGVNLNLPPAFGANVLRETEGKVLPLNNIFIFKVDAGRLVYADNPQGSRFAYLEPATIKFLALEFPGDLTEAIETYESGKFAEALPLLEKAITRYQALRGVVTSPVAGAEIMRLDCLRRLKMIPQLKDALAIAKPEAYDDNGKDYLITLAAWDAHAAKDWKRLEALSRDIDAMAAGTPAAELAFLRGEALSRLDRKADALIEYHRALTMDFSRSRAVFADAALAALDIYNDLPLVKEYFEMVGGPAFNPEAAYVIPAKEAALLAHLVQILKPAGKTLPANYNKFIDAWNAFEKDSGKSDAAAPVGTQAGESLEKDKAEKPEGLGAPDKLVKPEKPEKPDDADKP